GLGVVKHILRELVEQRVEAFSGRGHRSILSTTHGDATAVCFDPPTMNHETGMQGVRTWPTGDEPPIMSGIRALALLAEIAVSTRIRHHGSNRKGSSMAFKVVATPFGGRTDTSYPYEHEGLKPLGITIETADVSSADAYLASIRDADAVIAGGRWLNGEVI